VKLSAELFSACRSEFKHLEHFYFHNFVYERVWKENRRRHEQTIPTYEILRTYGPDYRLIFIGDAAMSPYEILMPGGSVEHWNEEPGRIWLDRLISHYRRAAWLNPTPERAWTYTQSITVIRQLMEGRMYPLTLSGIEDMTRDLSR